MIEQIQEVQRRLPSIVRSALESAPYLLAGFIGSNMEQRAQQNGAVAFAPSQSSRVATGTGALYRSFLPKDRNNITRITGTSVEIESKLRYAAIHEYGGKIQAKKKVSSVRRKKEVFAMEQFFWAKFKETGSPYYRNLALRINEYGFVTVPARPYFEPALKEFEDSGFDALLEQIMQPIAQIING